MKKEQNQYFNMVSSLTKVIVELKEKGLENECKVCENFYDEITKEEFYKNFVDEDKDIECIEIGRKLIID